MENYKNVRKKLLSEDEMLKNDLVVKLLGPVILKNKELNLTQTEISEKTGLTQANISKIFSFDTVPKLSTIAKLLDLYGLEVKVQEKQAENNSQKNN